MNDFDSRWRRAVREARLATDREDVAAPPGFAARVAARHAPRGEAVTPVQAGWNNWVLPLLGAMTTVLLVSAVLEWPHLRGPRPLETGIENAVAQLVWSL